MESLLNHVLNNHSLTNNVPTNLYREDTDTRPCTKLHQPKYHTLIEHHLISSN